MPVARFFRKTLVFSRFTGFYIYDLVISACRIAWDVVTIKDHSKPGFIDLPLDAKTDLEIAVVANLITFSPGTMVIGISKNRKFARVHLMFLEDAEAEIRKIKSNLESRVLEVLG